MRILRSIHTLNPAVGGPIESVRQSSAALAQRGHVVEIVCLDSRRDPWLQDFPHRVCALGSGRGGYSYTPEFTRWISEHHSDYDAVLIHGLWLYNSFGAWRALHRGATPYFVLPHGMLDPWFNRAYPLKFLKKLLYWPWAERRVLRDAAAVLFTSEEERRLARKSFPFYRCNEIVVGYGTAAPNVDLDAARAEFLARFPRLQSKRLLLFLGRLHEKKGCELLIGAFAAIRGKEGAGDELHLVIAGPSADESYLRKLQQLAAASVHDAITFPGMLSGAMKWGAFAAADAFVLSSHQENFGIAVVEALACGTPVLISNKVNIWREIVDAGAGFTDGDDAAGTERLLNRWLALSPSDADAMRVKARQCFQQKFDIERATDSLLEVLSRYAANAAP
jgi:glycosyltransferase involved in cell wall biosynthesis